MPISPDANMQRELARLCVEDDGLLCASLHVRAPNIQALHDARELARKVAAGENVLEPGASLGAALQGIYAASIKDQETWGYALAAEQGSGESEIAEPSR